MYWQKLNTIDHPEIPSFELDLFELEIESGRLCILNERHAGEFQESIIAVILSVVNMAIHKPVTLIVRYTEFGSDYEERLVRLVVPCFTNELQAISYPVAEKHKLLAELAYDILDNNP